MPTNCTTKQERVRFSFLLFSPFVSHTCLSEQSAESVRRAKEMGQPHIHPMFLKEGERVEKRGEGEGVSERQMKIDADNDEEKKKEADLLSQIRKFRPPHTILEIKAREKGSERCVRFQRFFFLFLLISFQSFFSDFRFFVVVVFLCFLKLYPLVTLLN